MTTLTVSSKGWVVIPAALRKKYSLNSGRKIQIVDYGGVLSLIPIVDDPIERISGLLKDGPSLTDILKAEHQKEINNERT